MTGHTIPKATLGRLPQYLHYLRQISKGSGKYISATAIARALHLGEVQVRKDLAAVSGEGKPKIGYKIEDLIENLENRLGCNQLTEAVLVGAGKLGRALLEYDGFEEYGVRIAAAFDSSESLLRITEKPGEILPIRDLDSFCRSHDIKLGIITVEQCAAQEVCDKMTACGIRAIWNFAPCSLEVAEDVILKQENFALSLAHLRSQLDKRI